MFQMGDDGNGERIALKMVKVVKQDPNEGGVQVVDHTWLTRESKHRDVSENEIMHRTYSVSINDLKYA